MRNGSVSTNVSALQPHRWAVRLSYHCSRISLFSRIANADIHGFRIANAEERGFIRPSCTHEKPTITKPDNTRLGIEHHKLPKANTKLPKPAPP